MSVFSTAYAGCYDSLYRDKDYESECTFLRDAFARHGARPVESILDLGCGTGGHALPLAREGWNVTGVDRSPEMVGIAQAKAKAAGVGERTRFLTADLLSFDAGEKFDVIICLFAVLSYLTKTDEVLEALRRVRRHLKPGGIFIFDFWSGPAVLTHPPADRFKIIEQENGRIIRLSHPVLKARENVVTIHYHLLELQGRELKSEAFEDHKIRYFFDPEMDQFLAQTGFKSRACHPSFRPETPITLDDWVVMVIAAPDESFV